MLGVGESEAGFAGHVGGVSHGQEGGKDSGDGEDEMDFWWVRRLVEKVGRKGWLSRKKKHFGDFFSTVFIHRIHSSKDSCLPLALANITIFTAISLDVSSSLW